MMDFLERRLSALEGELSRERERAALAENVLKTQASMRAEVEGQLKALTDQLRKEKAERSAEEDKSLSKGRIEALEQRLDEMHATWANLLKETLLAREKSSQAWPAEVVGEMREWRQAIGALPRLLDAVADLGNAGREGGARLQEELKDMVDGLGALLRDRLAQAERRQELENARQTERMEAVAREKLSLQEAFDERSHLLRQELLKERLAQESALNETAAGLAAKLDELARRHEAAAAQSRDDRALLDKAFAILSQPKARDEVLAELETENAELRKRLVERIESLRAYSEERRRIEATMGESLLGLNRELSSEKEKNRSLDRLVAEKDLELASLKDRLDAAAKTIEEREGRARCMAAERDEMIRAMLAESEKLRSLVDARRASDESWAAKLAELQKRLDEASDQALKESAAGRDLRGQLQTLSAHAAKALQDKDAVAQQGASWQDERARLLETLQKKDALISMLSAAFPDILKK